MKSHRCQFELRRLEEIHHTANGDENSVISYLQLWEPLGSVCASMFNLYQSAWHWGWPWKPGCHSGHSANTFCTSPWASHRTSWSMSFLPGLDVYSFVQSDILVQFQAPRGEGYPANAEAPGSHPWISCIWCHPGPVTFGVISYHDLRKAV